MAFRVRIVVVVALSFGIAAASPARADSITFTIVSGSAVVPYDDAAGFHVVGPGLALSGLFTSVPTSPQTICLGGCAPGVSIGLSSILGGAPSFNLGLSQEAVIRGTTYAAPTRPETWLNLNGRFSFTGGSVVAPGLPATPGFLNSVYLTAPFQFVGQVSGRSQQGGPALFNLMLTGQGTATLRLVDDRSGAWRYPEVTFSFEPSTPVPEPGALWLVATGVVGLCARGWQRRGGATGRPRRL